MGAPTAARNQVATRPLEVAIVVYPGMTALDAVGPYQVLHGVPDVQVSFVGERRGEVRDDVGLLAFPVETTLDDVVAPAVVVVPGGTTARRIAVDPAACLVDWIRSVHPSTRFTTSVCTGSLLLGAAGMLRGIDATSHWAALDLLPTYGANPTSQRVVARGRVITAAGVSAGLDMALVLASRLAGEDEAQARQLGLEYDPQPPFRAGSPLTAPAAVVERERVRLAEVLAAM